MLNKINLKNLNLRGCNIGVSGCQQLGPALEKCLLIEVLLLDRNNMCDDGLYYILKGLTKCPKIKHLSLIKKPNKL